mmetsp:Transcript_12545/g.22622  ORF Transcript_12545/g.22622 Transcript_12545/m.22622 type:complete len:238 (-) Transcript_12545:1524-2237(-)
MWKMCWILKWICMYSILFMFVRVDGIKSSFEIEIQFGHSKCFEEYLPPEIHVEGSYQVKRKDGSDMSLNLRIMPSYSSVPLVTKAELSSGSFSFQTLPVRPKTMKLAKLHGAPPLDPYKICVFHRIRQDELATPNTRRFVWVQIEWGADIVEFPPSAARWSENQRAIARIEAILADTVEELDHMHARERYLSNVTELINSQVWYFSVLSCIVLILTGFYQRWYLRRLFRSREMVYVL